MQTITTKLAAVKSCAAAAGWADNELRSLIHGVGGSPRRAKRVLKANPTLAKSLADAYAAAIKAGTPHITAVKAAAQQFAKLVPSTEAPEGGEGGDDDAADAAPAPAKAKPTKPAKVVKANATKPAKKGATELAALL